MISMLRSAMSASMSASAVSIITCAPLVFALLGAGGDLVATDLPPVISAAAVATPAIVVAKTAKLTMAATDDGGAGALTYAWTASGPGAVTFSATGTNAAKIVTATFKLDGVYSFVGTATDIAGQTVTSTVSVTVQQTLTTLAIAPTTAVVNPGAIKAFTATAKDQFGTVITGLVPTWTVTPPVPSAPDAVVSSIDSTGAFTAGQPGTLPVSVTVGAKTATASVRVNAAPTVVTGAAPASPTTAGKTADFTAQGADDTSVDLLTYTWSATGPKAVSFSPRSSVLGEHTVATFAALGDYVVTVVISDKEGLSTTSTTAITVLPTPTLVVISPTTAVVNPTAVKAFTAIARDQFGVVLAVQPAFTWSAVGGTVDAAGSFTAGTTPGAGSATVSVVGYPTATATATMRINAAPTVAIDASTPVSSISGTTAEFSVQGADDTSIDLLTYTWSATGPKGVTFSPRRSILGENTLATFAAVGDYVVTVVINDKEGLTVTSTTAIHVLPIPTSITISPTTAVVNPTTVKAFIGSAKDQFGIAMAAQPALSWTAVGGAVDATGHFTAGAAPGAGSATVSLTDQPAIAASATIRVNAAPTVATMAQAAVTTPATSVPIALSVLGADDDLEANLKYSWSVASGGTTGVVFSGATQNTNAAKAMTVTVSRTGTYVFKVTIRDVQGLTVTSSVSVVIGKITPRITWAVPADLTYGTALSATQLNATTPIPGTFTYGPTAGTLLSAGSHSLTVTFAPTDTATYVPASAAVPLTVVPATPVVTWNVPAAIVWGTALSDVQLDAACVIPGTFAYAPAASSVPDVGAQALSVIFTPTDVVNYTTASASVSLVVTLVTPVVTWVQPTAIAAGTALSIDQLNAIASVPGTITYDRPVGTVLPVGSTVVTATFVPDDAQHYTSVTQQQTIQVNVATGQAPVLSYFYLGNEPYLHQTFTAGAMVTDDGPLTDVTYEWTALENSWGGDPNAVTLSGFEQGTNAARDITVRIDAVGTYLIRVRIRDAEGLITEGDLYVTIQEPSSDIQGFGGTTWEYPYLTAYGVNADVFYSNAHTTVPGTFSYEPWPWGTLPVGKSPLRLTFTPTDASYPTTTAIMWVEVAAPDSGDMITPQVNFWEKQSPVAGSPISFADEFYLDVFDPNEWNAPPWERTFQYWVEYTPADGTTLLPIEQEIAVTIHPYDESRYVPVRASIWYDLRPPVSVAWATPAPIPYGTPLSGDQLNAVGSDPGTYVYDPPLGSVLEVGEWTLLVTFTPDDPTRFPVSTSVIVEVARVIPAVSVAPIHLTWGTTPTDAELIFTSSHAGQLHFPNLNGWDFQAGSQVIQATFTPTDTAHVATIMVPVTVSFDRAAPLVFWSDPWTIREGTPLSADQLNAAAWQSGSFTYTPAAGAILGVGTHILQATFTPADLVHFGPTTVSVVLTVAAATVDLPGIETTYGYDSANQMITRGFSTAASDHFAYDRVGRVKQATSGRASVTVERNYDAAGRVTTERVRIDQEELSIQSRYDAAGRLIGQTYPDTSVVQRDYTARSELAHVWDAGKVIAARAYDDGGRMVQTQCGNGLTESRTYATGESQVATIKVPGVTDFTYAYDTNKRKMSEVDGITTGNTQKFAYDNVDRVTDWKRTAGAEGPVQSRQLWDLSPVGDWISTTVDGTVQNRTHTPVHEIASVGSAILTSDFKGNLTRDDQGQEYAWDVENRLASAVNLKQGHGDAVAYVYDALGRRVKKSVTTHVPAAGEVPAHDVVEKTYFISAGAQEVIEITGDISAFNDPSADPEDAGAAPYDPLTGRGARGSLLADPDAQRVNFQPASTDTPDGWGQDLGQVPPAVTAAGWITAVAPVDRDHLGRPLYDSFAPIGSSAWSIPVENGTHAVVIMAGDADSRAQTNNLLVNGVPVRDETPYNGLTNGYETGSFDGYAVTVTVTDGLLTIVGDVDALDPKLNFIEIGPTGSTADQATIDRVKAAALQATHDTAKPKAKTPPTVRRNIWGGSYVDELLGYSIQKPRHGIVRYWVSSNHLFSPSAVTNSAGQVVSRYSYDAYGRQTVRNASGTVVTTSDPAGLGRGFTGYRTDSESGLAYARARMYSARLGRFISRDPLEYIDGWSVYVAYMVPNGVDPSGLGWLKRLKIILELCEKEKKLAQLRELQKQVEKGAKSFDDLVKEHLKKLDDYKKDPMAHDNKGLLANAPSEEVRLKIIQGRVNELESQINKQRGELEKAKQLAKEIESKIQSVTVAGVVCCLVASNSKDVDDKKNNGEDVSRQEVLKAASLDIIGIVDPGFIDLYQMLNE